jgi:hypothetical protein
MGVPLQTDDLVESGECNHSPASVPMRFYLINIIFLVATKLPASIR